MGDGEKAVLRLQFNPKVRLEFHGATITTDAGLLAFREFDDALGLTEIAEDYLQESRTGLNILHHLVPLLRQSIYSRLAGYDDTNDAVRLSQDPAVRVIVGWQGSERKGASTSEMGRFETEFLTQEDNRKGLARMNTRWVERAMAHTLHQRVILDMDSSESPVHGQQEGAAYNGHFECFCYHPLFLFNQFGDCQAAKLRSGNVHSAKDWQEVLDPVVERYLTVAVRLLFRADAALPKAHRLVSRFHLPGPESECIPTGGGQGGVAPGRTVSQSRLHSCQPQLSNYRDSPLLQRPRHGGAMDKRGKVRPELDEVVLPQVRGQPGQAGVVRTGLSFRGRRQLDAQAGLTRGDEALVADQSSDQDDQDRRTVGAPCQKAGVSTCRGAGNQGNAGRDTGTNWPASAGSWLVRFRSVGIGDGYGVVEGKRASQRGELGVDQRFGDFRLGRTVVAL